MQLWNKVAAVDAQRLFDVIADFGRYPEMTDAVRSVQVEELPDGRLASEWEVNFRSGILRWSEEDRLDPEQGRIRFEQTGGDFAHFSGEWILRDAPDGAVVGFLARFDLGIPSLSAMLDPIAENALCENITKILTGLSGTPVERVDAVDGETADPRLIPQL